LAESKVLNAQMLPDEYHVQTCKLVAYKTATSTAGSLLLVLIKLQAYPIVTIQSLIVNLEKTKAIPPLPPPPSPPSPLVIYTVIANTKNVYAISHYRLFMQPAVVSMVTVLKLVIFHLQAIVYF